MENVEDRLAKLERRNRWLWIALADSVAVTIVAACAAPQYSTAPLATATGGNSQDVTAQQRGPEAPPGSALRFWQEKEDRGAQQRGPEAPLAGAQDLGRYVETVRAERFIVEDADGNERALLAMFDGEPYLGLYGAEGNLRIGLGIVDGEPILGLRDADGMPRIGLQMADGEPGLVLFDADGMLRIWLQMFYGEPGLVLLDADENIIWRAP